MPQGCYGEAIADYAQVIKIEANDVTNWYNRGIAFTEASTAARN
ncbi:MAG: tetratricopeptide repeat protein [Symploca sp. SIO1B1]|nr:tetratricopeptide repeat protein [Symploca sp. SIO1B1]